MRYLFCIALHSFNAVLCAVYCRDERFLRLSCLSCACETGCLIYYGDGCVCHLWLLLLVLLLVLVRVLLLVRVLPVLLLLLLVLLLLWLVLQPLATVLFGHLFGQLTLVHYAVVNLLVLLQSKRVDHLQRLL